MKKSEENITLKLAEIVSKIFFGMILVLLPLYFDAKFYTAMITAKGKVYWVIAGVMAIGVLTVFIASFIRKEQVLRYRGRKNALDWALIAYAGAVLISFIFSENKNVAYFGSGGFYVGTLTLVSMIVFYFFVSRSLQGSKALWDMIIILNVFIFMWVVCDTISIDILTMHASIGGQNFGYYACLGQLDSVSAYLCLLLPIIIVFFVNEKKPGIWYYVFLVLGFTALTGIRTDGVYIGITVCAIFLIPYALKNMTRLQNMLWIGLIWGVAITFYSLWSVVAPNRIGTDMGVSGTLIKYWGGAIMIIICGGLLFWIEKKRILVGEKVTKILSRLASIGLVLVMAVFLLHGAMNLMQGDTGWGNGRGGIWLGALDLFAAYNPLQKLFGLGTTAIATDLTYYATALNGWKNVIVANAHNDFLEAMLSTGIVGLVTYTATWVIPIVEFVKQKKQGKEWSVTKVAYFMSLMAYLGQSIVGNPYSLSVPIMYLIFALYRNEDFQ